MAAAFDDIVYNIGVERSNFALRLLPSLRKAAERIAREENCSINQLINLALAEKIAVWDAPRFRDRRRLAALKTARETKALLDHAGDEPPQEGDELPDEVKGKKFLARKRAATR
jgi:hypothetical protein